MKQLKHIFLSIFFLTILSGCEKPKVIAKSGVAKKVTYNQKANQLILQIITRDKFFSPNSGCNCIIEIPVNSLSYKPNEPGDIEERKALMKTLDLNENDSVDSLVKVANEFKWDQALLEKNNILLITHDMVIAEQKKMNKFANIYEICPNAMLAFQRPIFDKHFKIAVIQYNYPYGCIPSPPATFKFESGEWIPK